MSFQCSRASRALNSCSRAVGLTAIEGWYHWYTVYTTSGQEIPAPPEACLYFHYIYTYSDYLVFTGDLVPTRTHLVEVARQLKKQLNDFSDR